MKYVLIYQCYDHCYIRGVYSTRELAQKQLDEEESDDRDDFSIQSFEEDKFVVIPKWTEEKEE